MTWNDELKIAIVEGDTTKIGTLTQTLPKYKTKESAEEALALITEAIKLIDERKQETLKSMNKLKQAKSYFS